MPAIPGPHHCIGTSKATIELVFEHLSRACTKAGGNLSAPDLVAAKQAIEASLTQAIDFSSVNSACRAAFQRISIDLSESRNLSAIVFYAYLQDVIKLGFQGQISRKPDWHRFFCLALVQLGEEQFNIAVSARLGKIYEDIAVKFGAGTQMKQFIEAPATIAAMAEVLAALRDLPGNQVAQRSATGIVNASLMNALGVCAPNVYLVSRTSLVRFAEKIEQAGTNKLRHAALELTGNRASPQLRQAGE